jgi:hypothetical protein
MVHHRGTETTEGTEKNKKVVVSVSSVFSVPLWQIVTEPSGATKGRGEHR